MHSTRRQVLHRTAASALLAGIGRQALAQAQIDALAMVTGAGDNDLASTFCRRIAQGMAGPYAKSVQVKHMTDRGGQAAIEFVKNAAPDGATCLQASTSALAIYPHLVKLPYDPMTDLSPVSTGCIYEFGLAVGPAVPASVGNVAEFLEWCRGNPSQAAFGTSGAGSVAHCIGALLARSGGASLRHQAYAGVQPAIEDMIGGKVPAVVGPVGDFTKYVMTGRCRLLATSGPKRSPFAGNTPTFVEQDMRGFVVREWLAFYMPAKAPTELVERMNATLRSVLGSPLMVSSLAVIGVEVLTSSPTEQAERLKADSALWGPIVKRLGLGAA